MAPQPFTPAGVTALQKELNALSAADLQTQANLIKSDLVGWVSDNFTLDSTQETYLKSIDARFIEYASAVTGFAVENKLTVILSVTGEPTTFKLIHLINDIDPVYSPDGFSVTGSITYEVSYE
jgi:threonine synthase